MLRYLIWQVRTFTMEWNIFWMKILIFMHLRFHETPMKLLCNKSTKIDKKSRENEKKKLENENALSESIWPHCTFEKLLEGKLVILVHTYIKLMTLEMKYFWHINQRSWHFFCWFYDDLEYGITGYGVSRPGIQNKKGSCIKVNLPKGNYWILRIGLMGSLSSLKKSEFV